MSCTRIRVPLPVRAKYASVPPSGERVGPVSMTASLKVTARGSPPSTGSVKMLSYDWKSRELVKTSVPPSPESRSPPTGSGRTPSGVRFRSTGSPPSAPIR